MSWYQVNHVDALLFGRGNICKYAAKTPNVVLLGSGEVGYAVNQHVARNLSARGEVHKFS